MTGGFNNILSALQACRLGKGAEEQEGEVWGGGSKQFGFVDGEALVVKNMDYISSANPPCIFSRYTSWLMNCLH